MKKYTLVYLIERGAEQGWDILLFAALLLACLLIAAFLTVVWLVLVP